VTMEKQGGETQESFTEPAVNQEEHFAITTICVSLVLKSSIALVSRTFTPISGYRHLSMTQGHSR